MIATIPQTVPQEEIFTVRELARAANVSVSWIHVLRRQGEFPGSRQLGHMYVIPRSVGEEWLNGQEINSDEKAKADAA